MIRRFNMSIVLTALTAVCAASAMCPGYRCPTMARLKNVAKFGATALTSSAAGVGAGFAAMKGAEKLFGMQTVADNKIAFTAGTGLATWLLGCAAQKVLLQLGLLRRDNAVWIPYCFAGSAVPTAFGTILRSNR